MALCLNMKKLLQAAAGYLVVSLLLVAAGAMPAHGAEAWAERVLQALDHRGLGPDALKTIDNLVSHEGPPPLLAPPLVRELLKDPLATVNAATLFERTVPNALRRLAEPAPAASSLPARETITIQELLTPYLDELAAAQRLLRAAAPGGVDASAVLESMDGRSPSAQALRSMMRAVDGDTLAHANTLFIEATARFVTALRAAEGRVRFPETAARFDSPIGVVVVGTQGDDAHTADAALIVDPGGNDSYARAPVTGGAVSVIIDLVGNDRYDGTDVVVHGLSAIVDVSGDDRYTTTGAGQGAAIAGASLLLDMAGDDRYEAGAFAQGAAAFGLGVIIDMAGNDVYRLRNGGQGYGMAGGVGLLWDRAGNDSYLAAGLPDAFARGGGISLAQGAAYGYRTSLGGGIGILRDDAGDDHYSAEMFAQGVGYYYGIGVLWDRGGNDRYQAVRYAQGNGVHEAVGVLRDESGNDSYTATVGVAQGMGLDLAVGVLYDGAGDDRYRGGTLVQGAATSNGIGLVIDAGGADRWHADDGSHWGDAPWARGLPTLGIMLHDASRAAYVRADQPLVPAPATATLGGALARKHVPAVRPSSSSSSAAPGADHACPAPVADATQDSMPLTEVLARTLSGFAGGKFDTTAYAQALRELTTRLRASMADLPRDDFDVLWTLGRVLECAARLATTSDIETLWRDVEQVLAAEPAHPFAGSLLQMLRVRMPPGPRMQLALQGLLQHPACSVRAGALRLLAYSATKNEGNVQARDQALMQVRSAARAALESPCWRLQLAARDVLWLLKTSFDPEKLPAFLREANRK